AGQMVSAAIEALPGSQRVAVIASGVLSGDIGGPRAHPGGPGGPPDEAWVRFGLDCMRTANTNDLLNATTRDRLRQAGNVAGEILNWIALLGVVAEWRRRGAVSNGCAHVFDVAYPPLQCIRPDARGIPEAHERGAAGLTLMAETRIFWTAQHHRVHP